MRKWIWIIALFPAGFVLIFGLVGLLYPYWYLDFYSTKTIGMTFRALSETRKETALLLETMFRANGLGMTMSGILALFIIIFPMRKGERWAYIACGIAGGIGIIGEILLEVMVL